MKKLLALVLALVMVLSLCTVTNAAYPDAADVDYKEAVDVMSAIGVFQGDEKGNFNPDDSLTREQAAKILTYMLLGKKNADTLVTIAAPYADVAATRWSAGSIAYCTNEGILAGMGDGTFAPTEPLTGLAFAKMCLVALGYDAEIEGLVGSTWSINVAKLALQAGLTKELDDVALSGALTREQAAQMAFNTELATMVAYNGNTTITAGDVTIQTQTDATKVPHSTQSGYKKADNDAYTQFCEEYATKLVLAEGEADDFGHPASEWKNDKTIVGTYADEADLTYTAGVKGTDLADDIDDADLKADKAVKVVRNGGEATEYSAEEVAGALKDSEKLGGNGILVELYDKNDDDSIDYAVVTVTYLAKVTKVTKDKTSTAKVDERALDLEYTDLNKNTVKLTVDAEDELDEFDAIYEAVEANDFVLVIPKGDNSASKDVLTMSLPETVEGKVTKSTNSSVTVGGTKYDLAKTGATPAVGKEVLTVYLDAYGYVIGSEKVEEEKSDVVALVSVFFSTDKYNTDTWYAQVVTAEGEVLELKLPEKEEGYELSDFESPLYTYTTDSKDVATLEAADYDVVNESIAADAAYAKVSEGEGEPSKAYFADEVTFVYIDGEKADLKVTTADEVEKVTLSKDKPAVVVLNKDGEIETVFVLGKADTTVDADDLLFVAKTAKAGTALDKDDKTGDTYEFYKDGEKQTEIVSGIADAGFYTYSVDEETGRYVLTAENDNTYVIEVDETTIMKDKYVELNSTLDAVVLADDCDFYNTTDEAIDDLADVADLTAEGVKLSIGAVYDTKAEVITCLYVFATPEK